jgi:arylsulfatase
MIKDEKPFFLYLAHIAPHFPLQARKEDIAKYRGKYLQGFERIREERFKKQIALGIIPEDFPISEADAKVPAWNALSGAEKDDYDLRMSVYAAQIESMDRGIGELIAKLKKTGELDNTMIVFLSDNGGTREDYSNANLTAPIGDAGSFNCYKLPWANVSNTPYRKFKHWGNEGGIRSPFIVHYPNMIKEERIDSQPAHIIDIMTTFTEIAEAKYPLSFQGKSIQKGAGKSLIPIFNNENRIPHQGLYWEHEGNKAARVENWKWVSTYPEYIDELYNLTDDPFEANNLAEANAKKLKAVKDKWQIWADEVGVIPWEKVLESKPDQARLQIWY